MTKSIVTGIILLLVIVSGVFYFSRKPAPGSPVPLIQSSQSSSTPQALGGKQRSKSGPPPVVLSAQMSTNLASSGAALKPKTVFSPKTPNIYAVLSLKNATQRTQISYIRYYRGKYVDAKVSHPSKNGAKYFHFSWRLKTGKTRKVGNYNLVFYLDGKKIQSVGYSIK